MNREKTIRFYENMISDIRNESLREELLEKLEEIDTLILDLEMAIEDEVEYQDNHIEDEIGYDYELFRRSINQ